MAQPPMAPPMDHAHPQPPSQPQQWNMMAPPPQYHPHPPQPHMPMWNQQPSQVPPPQPVPPQQYPPQYGQQQQYQQQPPAQARGDEIRTLWIGDLPYWAEEVFVGNCFAGTGEVVSIKVIRNKQTGQSEGYGFIEFGSRATAERVLQTYNGQIIPGTEQKFRLNWASLGAGEKRDDSADHPIFVGDLAADVTDYVLEETFRAHYPSVKGAKVVMDRTTGCSKGYGFVKFGDPTEQQRAMTEMNGVFCSTRPMRIGPAASKKNLGLQQQQYPAKTSYQSSQTTESESDPNNTTIFVGGLDSSVSDDALRQVFSQYGELVHVKIPVGKRCGFVQFATRACAEEALQALNGTQLGGQNIRLSWGRSPNKQQGASGGQFQQPQDQSQWNNNYYGYSQGGYDQYGYAAAAPQDPNMYAYGGYPGYGNYQQQQQ